MFWDGRAGKPGMYRLNELEALGQPVGERGLGNRPATAMEHKDLRTRPFADHLEVYFTQRDCGYAFSDHVQVSKDRIPTGNP